MLSSVPLDARLTSIFASDPEAIADPFPVWDELVRGDRVVRCGPKVLVPRYADVRALLRRADVLSNRAFIEGSEADANAARLTPDQHRAHLEVSAFESHYVSRNDGASHARLRDIARRAFTPRRIAELERSVAAIVDDLLDAMDGSDRIDVVSHLAYRLPLLVIIDLLGVPREDQDRIHRWSSAIGRNRGADDPRALMDAHRAMGEFRHYVGTELLPGKRGADAETDLVAALMGAESDERLSEEELTAMFVILLFAGHETTTNLLASGLLALLRDGDQWRRIVEDPGRAGDAVEELLRFVSPVQWVLRVATDELAVGDHRIAAGETVALLLAAANRDPELFVDPATLDIDRANARDHVALGYGPHFCLGNALARMEGTVVFRRLAEEFPGIALADVDLAWRGNAKLRSLAALPVVPGPRAGSRR